MQVWSFVADDKLPDWAQATRPLLDPFGKVAPTGGAACAAVEQDDGDRPGAAGAGLGQHPPDGGAADAEAVGDHLPSQASTAPPTVPLCLLQSVTHLLPLVWTRTPT